jgi:alpha-galactosidase/6-phospho-beta-glucosidase family protein
MAQAILADRATARPHTALALAKDLLEAQKEHLPATH